MASTVQISDIIITPTSGTVRVQFNDGEEQDLNSAAIVKV